MMIEKKSQRLVTSDDYNLDAYFLSTDSFGLFCILKNPSIDFKSLAESLIEKFHGDNHKVAIVGGALKMKKESVPLKPLILEPAANKRYIALHNGFKFYVEFEDALNPGIFLDQEANREILIQKIKSKNSKKLKLLNLFSYTGAFSVVSRGHGCDTVSVDVSKRYLNWEKQNHELNGFQEGYMLFKDDSRDFLKRELKRDRRYDFIILDPPTFSRSDGKVFQVEKELPSIVETCVKLLSPKGSLLVSTNDASLHEREWSSMVDSFASSMVFEEGKLASGFLPSTHALRSIWLTND